MTSSDGRASLRDADTEHSLGARVAVETLVGPSGHPLFPGGYNRATFNVGPWCPMAVEGSGYLLVDELGREIIDLNNNFTALIHGHAHPKVVAAGHSAISQGSSFGLPNRHEVRLARALLSRFGNMDQVRFANSGTEAVMAAVRLARAYSSRPVVAFIEKAYHGLADTPLSTSPFARGVTQGVRGDVRVLPHGDVEALEALFAEEAEHVAGVVLDLIPNRAGLVPLPIDFVRRARELTRRHGSVLIVDEVISARLNYRGHADSLGIQPDVMTLGKMIGGGLPVGAVLGVASIMERFDPSHASGVEMGGTFSGNPVTMASGLAAMELYDEQEVARLNALGSQARKRLDAHLEGRPWDVRGEGSLLRAYCERTDTSAHAVHLRVWQAAYRRGILILPNGLACLSTPMSNDVVDHVVDELARAVVEVDDSLGQ